MSQTILPTYLDLDLEERKDGERGLGEIIRGGDYVKYFLLRG